MNVRRVVRFVWLAALQPLLLVATCPVWIPLAMLAHLVLACYSYAQEKWKEAGDA